MLAPWKKSCDKPRQCIKKQRHYFDNKGLYIKSYGFPSSHVLTWELDHKEIWAPKNRWLFELWCWRRLLRVPWISGEKNKSILKEVNIEYSLEGLMLKTLHYFGHLIGRANSLEKKLMLGKTEGKRRRRQGWDGWLASLTQSVWIWASSERWWRTGKPGMVQSMGFQRVRHDRILPRECIGHSKHPLPTIKETILHMDIIR